MASFLARIHFAIFFFIFLPDSFNAILSVHPPVLFLDEDWPLNRPLDVKICTDRRVEDSLELRILSGNEAEINLNGIGLPQFGIVPLNKSCAGLVLNAYLDVDQNINDQKLHKSQQNSISGNSFSLLIENIENKERAALQIEVVDVNDNSPHFLGGPFPLELVIPVDSPSGFLLRRLEVFDPDQGIGGISRFFLHSPNNRSRQLFSLDGQHCEWSKCSVELHLRQPMEEGERMELRVKARDGAGLTQIRANEAEVEIRVLAVAEQKQSGNAKNDGEDEEEVTEMGSNPFESDLEKAIRGIVNNRKNGVKANSTTITTKLASTTEQPFTTAPLITFGKKASSSWASTPQIGTSPMSIPITTNVEYISNSTKLALNLPSTIPPIPPTNFFIDPLSEDSPIGLELLRIPFGESKTPNGFQFVQFDGSNSLRMLPNGSIQLVGELEAEKWPELRAEIRKSGGELLATIRANIRPMMEQFREWIGGIEEEIYLNQSSAELIGPKRILWLPISLAKYAKLNCPNSDGWKLVGRELLFNDLNVLGRHCCQLEMKYKEHKIVAKQICVQIAENIVPIEVHWPANNSRHFFMENLQFPVFLTFNSTGPKTMFYAIDQTFHDGPHFLIDPNNGQLSSSEYSHFDYEIQNQFSLAILICPNKQNLEENVTKCHRICLQLEVLDANDHCPKFETQKGEEKRIIIELSEATKPNLGQPIGQFQAGIDGDGSEGQRSICYRLEENELGPGGGKIFGIGAPEKPELFLLKTVDRELVPNYQLKVLVDDCPWIDQKCPNSESENNSLTIFVKIVDVNDNPPRFSRRHFFAALLRPFQPGEALLQLRAEDPDEIDQHGRLRFGWGEGMVQTDGDPLPIADCPFRLNRSSGELSLRENLSSSSTDELERISTFTFRVRVKDKAPVHEDQATVTISVLDPFRHLMQLSLGRADAQLESELPHLERLLSALAPERGWLVQVHRMTECGGTNCTELIIYLLDRMFRPIEAKLGIEVLTKAGRERPGQMRELKQKFGLIGIEEAAKTQQKDHHSLRASSPADDNSNHSAGGLLQWIRRLFSLSPLAIFAASLLAILALAFPPLCCRLICLQLRKFRAHRGPKLLANRSGIFGANGGGTLGRMNPSFGQGGIRLMMVANPPKNGQINNNTEGTGGGMPNEFLNENAYIAPKLMDGREAKRLRWQTESEDFEFPAPPPVQMYGSGTLTIPRAKGASNSSMATEF